MGLLYGPSRKQYDWVSERKGPPRRLEDPITFVDSTDINVVIGTSTQTIFTTPAGKRSRLLYLQVYPTTGTFSQVEVLVNGERLYLWIPGVSPDVIEFRWTIDDGPQFYTTMQLRYTATAASSPGIYSSFIVNTEPAGEGIYTSN